VANMMVGEGMLQGGSVKVSMKKAGDGLDFEVKKTRVRKAAPAAKVKLKKKIAKRVPVVA